MIYNIFPTKDTTLYDYSQSMNTGRDPILEVEKLTSGSDFPGTRLARTLLWFDWDKDFSGSLTKAPGMFAKDFEDDKFSANLVLYTADAKAIPYSYVLEGRAPYAKWDMGIGKRDHTPPTEIGASWKFTDYSGSSNGWNGGGGFAHGASFYTTQSFEFEATDVKIDVSSSLALWRKGSANNTGICLSFSSSLEVDALSYGSLKFFSMDTNTIYSPRIQVGWDDSIWSTGSMEPLTTDEILVYVKNGKYEYHENEVARFEIRGRDIFPQQTYGTSSAALVNNYLPSSSYWSIEDAETEEKVIDFDSSYTKLSCTSSGNFFNFPMNTLTSERLYKIVLKVENRNWANQVEIFDVNQLFKVVR